MTRPGRYGGTYAHKDIAFKFASWISVELEQLQMGAICRNMIPAKLSSEQINYIYASEADVLNMASFGMPAKEWRES